MARAVRRVAEQDRRADAYLAQMPMLDEPAPKENFDYPVDPVIDTPKIRKLRKRT
jgi:hypothetical protein